ncbi:hypothetical protein SSP531S_57040 [Streptomyces spongiicola]|uniref:Uncharacterized protein n=1 Tax=Streptomyces spongiicola TaxID=1690221 RepID=A0A388T7D7_9ACTN|nr:hypothetical protein SSP531S_57040 [Streptomyces spongiicola]
MPGPGETQRLGALPHADVEDAQPLPDGEAGGQLLVELPCHEFLPNRVAQSAETPEPGGGAACETGDVAPAGSLVLPGSVRSLGLLGFRALPGPLGMPGPPGIPGWPVVPERRVVLG